MSSLAQQLTVTNSLVNTITDFGLVQGDLTTSAPTEYEIRFKPKNEMPKTGVVTIVYPPSVALIDGESTKYSVFLEPGRREVTSTILIDTEANTITISQFLVD